MAISAVDGEAEFVSERADSAGAAFVTLPGPDACRGGAAASALSAVSWFQPARKSCDLWSLVRLVVQQSFWPSGENTGRPSKPSVKVTRTGSRVPAASTRNSSKLSNPSLFEVKMI